MELFVRGGVCEGTQAQSVAPQHVGVAGLCHGTSFVYSFRLAVFWRGGGRRLKAASADTATRVLRTAEFGAAAAAPSLQLERLPVLRSWPAGPGDLSNPGSAVDPSAEGKWGHDRLALHVE